MIKNKPEAYGISSDNLLCMVQELETFVEDIHSISVVCDNDVIFSKCIQPYTEEPMQMLHSFSKSMNSIAVGIAIDEGKLHLDDLVIDYFKEYLPEEYDKRIDQLTVRNLLTMAANSCRLSTCFRGVTDSWITHYFTYKLPHDPGTVFQYDTGASYMLSSLVTKTMHKNVLALMKERVLKPMGITDIEWLESPEGNTVGGWGLYLKTPDIAKIAILLANMGKWNGKTLIPEEYLKEATRKQIDTPEEKYPVCGYGYQYWITADHSFGVYGAFGNVIVVNPEKKLAVAITAGASDKNGNPNRLISKIVNEKLFIPTERGTLETDVDGEKKLNLIDDGVKRASMVIMNTAAVVGFGYVVKSTVGFQNLIDMLSNLGGNPLISFASATTLIAGATGSGSGGIGIAMEVFAQKYMDLGVNPEVLHRIAAIACNGLDTLPHNSMVITCLAACGMTHKESYKPIFITSVCITLIGLAFAVFLGIAFY